MADGSVIIAAELDTESFTKQINTLEIQLAELAGRLQTSVQAAVTSSGVDTSMLFITSAVLSAMETIVTKVPQYSASAARNAVAGFSSADWAGSGRMAANGITAGFSEGAAYLTRAAQITANQVKNAFSQNWHAIGISISEGIAAGISASAGTVAAAIKAVSDQTIETAKQVYNIASPSKVMREEVGAMLSRGIAEGILEGSSYIEASLAQTGQRTSLTNTVNTTTSGTGHIVQNIYLRENDTSPYATARAIRRESENLLRI